MSGFDRASTKAVSKMTIREALQTVIQEATGSFAEYAKTYARAALEIGGSESAEVKETEFGIEIVHEKTGQMMVGEELRVQILYVLSNLAGWRGETAREVKKFLKAAIK